MSSDRFGKLVEIIAALRGENGCPWDKQQTHETLKKDLLEEAYEAVEAIDVGSPEKLKEELGDLLMVVLLQVQIAVDDSEFSLDDVLEGITEKLIRRHPHVFGDAQVESADEVLSNWEAIKSQEASHASRQSLMDGIPRPLPALMAARKIQRRAARAGFDWDNIEQMLPKLSEELGELEEALEQGSPENIHSEFGDLLFSMVNLSRFLDLDPEAALRGANGKFANRFRALEQRLAERGQAFEDHDLEGLDAIWEEVKRRG